MSTKPPLLVAGIIFLIVGILHFVRYFYNFNLIVMSYDVPQNVSLVAGIILLLLSAWMFLSRR